MVVNTQTPFCFDGKYYLFIYLLIKYMYMLWFSLILGLMNFISLCFKLLSYIIKTKGNKIYTKD